MISNYLKEYFKQNKISQYEIEKKTGIKQCKISLFLNNRRKITADELFMIAIRSGRVDSIKRGIKKCQYYTVRYS